MTTWKMTIGKRKTLGAKCAETSSAGSYRRKKTPAGKPPAQS